MHMFARDKRFYGGHGIVGASVPLGTGLAFAHRYREDGGVCLCYFGDGATNQGQVYESFNMAALWKLPIVYVIENNKYGMGTRSSAPRLAAPRYTAEAKPTGSPASRSTAWTCWRREAGAEAVAHAREQGPHSGSADLSLSRPLHVRSGEVPDPDEVQHVREERDPIDRLRKLMLDEGIADEEAFKTIDKEIRAVVNEAASFAQDSPEPDPEELYTDVYLEA